MSFHVNFVLKIINYALLSFTSWQKIPKSEFIFVSCPYNINYEQSKAVHPSARNKNVKLT